MPRETIFFIRCAFVWLVASCTGLIAVALYPDFGSMLRPVVFHGFVIGWLSQFIFGVAHWLFPKHPAKPPRGDVRQIWWIGAVWNAALMLRVVAEPLVMLGRGGDSIRGLLVLSSVLLVAGSGSVVLHLWPRTRGLTR